VLLSRNTHLVWPGGRHRPASEAICASTDGRGGHGGSSGYYHSGISTSAMAASGGTRRLRPRRRGGWKLSDAAPSARRNPDWREHARALGFALADNAGAPYLGETAHRTFTAVEPASPWRRATLAEASVLATGSVVFGLLKAACLA
jgi:hypothetical protein